MSERDAILHDLDRLRAEFPARFEAAKTEQALRDENAKILGKKGELTAILKQMGKVPADERKLIGEKVNTLKDDVERAFDQALRALAGAKRQAELDAPPFDLTLPGREPAAARFGPSHLHRARRDRVHLRGHGLRRLRRPGDRLGREQLRQAGLSPRPPRHGHARHFLRACPLAEPRRSPAGGTGGGETPRCWLEPPGGTRGEVSLVHPALLERAQPLLEKIKEASNLSNEAPHAKQGAGDTHHHASNLSNEAHPHQTRRRQPLQRRDPRPSRRAHARLSPLTHPHVEHPGQGHVGHQAADGVHRAGSLLPGR